ncbi:MAG: hypothetical protein ABF804_10505 [Liquorilactobacillus ghanensis]|jgi:hypothetical protein|uniref:Uncharacterized protein n=1 Tax=Liquorilactobacillus ghanensis DSM 18630 TaxID=1423750 RepID=A0A0R1VL05_9LACO|nr:hypothetical protein [Liquorilactobacillus ghanensis]KRM06279.1 hypothetical protein FC89_GL001151 [Liquorilactobacillus ghanensis DSM 18630]
MADKKIKIDPAAFACSVVSGSNLTGDDDEKDCKKALVRYLTAYLLVEKFNNLEANQFKFINSKNFEYLMSALDSVKPR